MVIPLRGDDVDPQLSLHSLRFENRLGALDQGRIQDRTQRLLEAVSTEYDFRKFEGSRDTTFIVGDLHPPIQRRRRPLPQLFSHQVARILTRRGNSKGQAPKLSVRINAALNVGDGHGDSRAFANENT